MSEERQPTNQTLLIRIESRLTNIESKIDTLSDHEDRLRELEKARYQSTWITSILSSAMASSIVYLIVRVII